MKKNILLTFICACFPGFGQMYYGYMRRGTSLALWFWGLVFFASFSGLGMLGILLPVIWAYSFFDTFNIRSLTPEQYAAFGDDFIPNRDWLRQVHLDRVFEGGKLGKVVGWVLIIFGLLILYNVLFAPLVWRLYDYAPFLAGFIEAIPPLFIAGVVILLGLYILRGKKPNFIRKNEEKDDYPYGGTYPYDNWQDNPTPPPSGYTTSGPVPGWDPRTNPGPVPPWDQNAAQAAQAPVNEATAATAATDTPLSPEMPTAPEVPTAADIPVPPAPPNVEKEIVLTLEETAVVETDKAEEPAEAAKTEEDKGEEAPSEEKEEKGRGKKGRKKDKEDENDA